MLKVPTPLAALCGVCLWLSMSASATQERGYSPPPFSYYQPILERMPFGERPADTGPAVDPNAAREEARLKGEQEKLARQINMSAVNVTPQGQTAIGFTDLSAKPPASYYLTVGSEAGGWRVLSADYESETAEIEKDGITIALKLGKGLVQSEAAKPKAGATPPPLQTTVKTPVIPVSPLTKNLVTAKTNTERAAQSAAAIRDQLRGASGVEPGGDVRSYMERLRERKIQESSAVRAEQEAQRQQLEKLAREVASKEIKKQTDALAEEAALKKELALEEERLKALEEERLKAEEQDAAE
jgi:hypothetical protein